MDDYCVIVTTTYNKEEADTLTRTLLSNSLVACVQESEVASSYIWNGKIETSYEYRLELKSRRDRVEEIIDFIKKNHSYNIPEIIVLPIVEGNSDYFRWIDELLTKKS